MRIKDLDQTVVGKRIVVTSVAPSEAEQLGHCDDTKRLTGQTGVAERLNEGSYFENQLRVKWDEPSIGLMLAGDDEIAVLS